MTPLFCVNITENRNNDRINGRDTELLEQRREDFREQCLWQQLTELLRQAAALAQPDGLVTPLAENGRYLRELLPEYGTLGREAAELSRVLEQGTQQEQRPEALAPLTEREWAVAQRMARRLSNREIAGQLFLTEGTVKQYINQIYSKLHLTGDVRTKRRRLEELMGE